MQVSEKDPYMKAKVDWRPFHKPIASTEELMESLEPYESRRLTHAEHFDRFRDQEKRYYKNRDEIQREQSYSYNQKRQMETMANPDEASKLQRLKKELGGSR